MQSCNANPKSGFFYLGLRTLRTRFDSKKFFVEILFWAEKSGTPMFSLSNLEKIKIRICLSLWKMPLKEQSLFLVSHIWTFWIYLIVLCTYLIHDVSIIYSLHSFTWCFICKKYHIITFEFVYYWIQYLQYYKDYLSFFTGKVVVIRKQVNFLLILTLAHATSEWDEPFLPFSRRTLQWK